jgi:7,8-dihydropterin-6-yl-methyl-4-(beta-D-ribofuranosyl)aminobenzene 5'-phosphate synthase
MLSKPMNNLACAITLALTTTVAGLAQPAKVERLRVEVLSTMLTGNLGIGEWGFSALIESDGRRILFDTGARPDTVAINARELKVDLAGVTDVILTHHHGDHTGGLVPLRRDLSKRNPAALSRTWAGAGIFDSIPGPDGAEGNAALLLRPRYEALGGKFSVITEPAEIAPGVWLTGPVPRRHPERNFGGADQRKTAAGLIEDIIQEDASVVVTTSKGLVVITGCGHAGIVNTLEYARERILNAPVYAVIGGMHLFQASDETLDWTAGNMRQLGVQYILGAHCTGIEAVMRLRSGAGLSRKTCAVAAVGATFDLIHGMDAGVIAR